MADTLESLEIEVRHSASGAADEITKVAHSIVLLKESLRGVVPKFRELVSVMNETKGNFALNLTDNSTTQIADTINNVKQASTGARRATQDVAKGIKEVSKEAAKSKKPLDNFLSSLKRIAFYRIIRGIIKSISQAFQEGLEKAYLFSAGMTGESSRFAAAMDNIKSHGNAMKGQLGSAFISLLAAVQPILITLINLVTKAADAISQLFAAFTGKTYLKANATAAQFADTMKAGGAAAKEWKNQLLGFDEINRLNEPSNGGGGGGSNPLAGFEMVDAPINEKLLAFIDRIKNGLQPAIDRCKEAFDRLKEAWERLKTVFDQDTSVQNLIADLIVLGGDLVINGITLLVDILTTLLDLLNALNDGDWKTVWEDLGNTFGDLWKTISDLVWDGLIVFADVVDGLIPGEQHFADGLRAIRDGTAQVTEALEDGTTEIYTVEDAFNDWTAKMNGSYKPALDSTGDSVNSLKEDFRLFAQDVGAFISSLFQPLADLCAWIDSALQGFAFLNAAGNVNVSKTWAGEIERPRKFASGGFPEDGLFFANHNELVGQFSNGKTAVANNEQITEGIRQAVYDAFTAANGGDNEVSVKVFLDSREIKAGQQRLNRAWGVG